MGGACGTYDREEACIQSFSGEHKGEDHLEDLGTTRWLILEKNLQERRWEGMDCTGLNQVRNKWWKFVNVVMNNLIPQNARNFLTS
jgi:hypothetical protein